MNYRLVSASGISVRLICESKSHVDLKFVCAGKVSHKGFSEGGGNGGIESRIESSAEVWRPAWKEPSAAGFAHGAIAKRFVSCGVVALQSLSFDFRDFFWQMF